MNWWAWLGLPRRVSARARKRVNTWEWLCCRATLQGKIDIQGYGGDCEKGIGDAVRLMRIVLCSQQLLHGPDWEAGVAGNGDRKIR